VTVFAHKSQQDVQRRRGERQEFIEIFLHTRIPLYRNPTGVVKAVTRDLTRTSRAFVPASPTSNPVAFARGAPCTAAEASLLHLSRPLAPPAIQLPLSSVVLCRTASAHLDTEPSHN
jgi:hypothetical protein